MEPAGLEQLLRELLLPDTERIRRVRDRRGTRPGRMGGGGKGPTLTPGHLPQATEQLQTALRDPAALPALCDLLASAADPQVRLLPLPARRPHSTPPVKPRLAPCSAPSCRTLTGVLLRLRSASSRLC